MNALLITQCLQVDFVMPLVSEQSLPTVLHIGNDESKRLIGDSIELSPIHRFMSWANKQSYDALKHVHIRDWHDENALEQKAHLKQFGPHCLQNTKGAEFIFEPRKCDEDLVVNSTTLNDFHGTGLADHLDKFKSEPLIIGLIGVWTEAKILFLAYELSTRYLNATIAVCSALTASSSRSQHFLALQQLQRIVGVTVIDSVGKFIRFLGGEENTVPIFSETLVIEKEDSIDIQEEDESLIRYLFRDCQSVTLKILDGGFSGNLVASVKSLDIHGHEQAPHVLKIGERDLMARERTAFEQIETVLGNHAPRIADYADFNERGAIKYRYASMGNGAVKTFQNIVQENQTLTTCDESMNRLSGYLEDVFRHQLGRFYRASVTDRVDLLNYYCFDSRWSPSVANKMSELNISVSSPKGMCFPNGTETYNLAYFYQHDLERLCYLEGDFPMAFIHGDLNGANIIIDQKDNVWLIDFFHTHRGHLFKDFVKLENDALYIYTPIENDDDFRRACIFTDFLLEQTLTLELMDLPQSFKGIQFSGTAFERTYALQRSIRQSLSSYLDKEATMITEQWLIAQLRYAVHTMGFDEPNLRQRQWAAYTAGEVVKKLISR